MITHRRLIIFAILLAVTVACSSLSIFEENSTQPEAMTTPPSGKAVPSETVPSTAPTLPPAPAPNIQISGSVSDNRTGDPLPTATIYLGTGHSNNPLSTIATDARGFFTAQNLQLPLIVRVQAPGYQLWEATFNTAETLPNPQSPPLQIQLLPHVTTGMVRATHTHAPLAGVTLHVESNGRLQTAVTDAAGAFELYGLLPNDVISLEPPAGYRPLQVSYAGQAQLSLTLDPQPLTVIVQDSFTGQPLEGGLITIAPAFSATIISGQATITNIPAQGQLVVSKPGYISATLDYTLAQTLNVSLRPAGLQGVINSSDTGQPLPQTVIYLADTYFRADDNGHFVLPSLPVTSTQFMLKTAGYHRAYAQLTPTGLITGYRPAPFSGGEGRWLTAVSCAQPPQPEGPPCVEITLEPFQARAIYVPLHYLRSRERMIEYLDFIAATELNAIVVDVKGDFGFIAWDSQVELVSEVGADEWFTDTWLPLDEFIAEAKARNIYTIARMVVFKDNPLANSKPEWAAVREDGTVWLDREELGWANPFRQEVWEYNIALAKEVAAFGFDEINFDYIRFPSDGDVGAIVYEEENTLETRTTAIREFMTRMAESLRPTGVFVSADVFGLTLWVVPDSDMRIGQRVIDVAPQVDYLAPMVYPSTFIPGNLGYDNPSAEPYGVVYRSQEQAETLVPPYVKVRPWLQGYWYSLEEMQQLKQAAIDSESTGWSWWNAGGKYDDELFEPAQPE